MVTAYDLNKAAIELAKNDFRKFLVMVFYELNPAQKFETNWHLDYICSLLEKTLPNVPKDQRIRRLIINVPPRSLKSVIFSVALKAYLLGHYPHEQIIGASYSAKLAKRFNVDLQRVMNSTWYKQMFPFTVLAKQTEELVTTTQGGQSFVTSEGGTVTGVNANYLVVDDLLNPQQALSDIERTRANTFFDGTLYNRQNDPNNGVIIVVMQRLHENDLTGHLLAKSNSKSDQDNPLSWYHVSLPARFGLEPQTFHFYDQTHTTKPNELLHPARLSHATLKDLELQLGAYEFANQYMQEPAPAEGGLLDPRSIHPAKYTKTKETPLPPNTQTLILSADTAIKATQHSDDSVFSLFAVTTTHYYLLELFFGKLEFPQLKQQLLQCLNSAKNAYRLPVSAVLIEDKASGQSLIQHLRQETALPTVPITPTQSKEFRAASASPTIHAGKLLLPPNDLSNWETPPHFTDPDIWLPVFRKQFTFFPNAKNDDFVDSVTQFINWQNSRSTACQPRIRVL